MPRKGIMLAYPLEEKRIRMWNCPVIVQPKLDGERCRAVIDAEGEVTLLSSEENVIVSVPHINEQIRSLKLRNLELDGELYSHGMDFSEIHSRVGRTINLHHASEDVEYHIFDLVSSALQHIRITTLFKLIPPSKSLQLVRSVIAPSWEGVMCRYDEFLKLDYEGIIVRHLTAPYMRKRSTCILKFKPKKDDFYTIVGYNEEISIKGEPKGRLGSLTCIGDDGTKFSVGSGLSDEMRVKHWQERIQLVGKTCHVAYQHLTPNKVPRFPIFIEVLEARSYVGLT